MKGRQFELRQRNHWISTMVVLMVLLGNSKHMRKKLVLFLLAFQLERLIHFVGENIKLLLDLLEGFLHVQFVICASMSAMSFGGRMP